MKYLLFLVFSVIVSINLVPVTFADEQKYFEWRFCQENIIFPYSITNGTLKETAHLRLHNYTSCDAGAATEFQLQLFHTSNNQTHFTIDVPENLEFGSIQVRALDKVSKYTYDVHEFWLNDTTKSLNLNDYTHDQSGLVTIILDFFDDMKINQ